jgi:hypothetical protein
MSAWIPHKEHIDLLVKTTDVLGVHYDDDLSAIGQMFVDEVVKSVSYRYPGDDVQAGELPGPCDPYYLAPYAYADPGFMPDAAEMRQIVGCYSYQACEHPAWESSEANSICEAILAKLGDGTDGRRLGLGLRTTVARRIEQGASRSPRPSTAECGPWSWWPTPPRARSPCAGAKSRPPPSWMTCCTERAPRAP